MHTCLSPHCLPFSPFRFVPSGFRAECLYASNMYICICNVMQVQCGVGFFWRLCVVTVCFESNASRDNCCAAVLLRFESILQRVERATTMRLTGPVENVKRALSIKLISYQTTQCIWQKKYAPSISILHSWPYCMRYDDDDLIIMSGVLHTFILQLPYRLAIVLRH